jgi:predicted membrane protein DUF2207
MTRKFHIAIIAVLFASLVLASPAEAAKEYEAEQFDVQIDLQEDGSAIITETVRFHFAGDPFTFAFREISARETDGVTFLEAQMDGSPLPPGTQAGQVEVATGDPLTVTWHFTPTTNTSHVLAVRYLAKGVIRKGAADTLIWRAVPEDHEYPIGSSTVTLTYPSAAALLETPSLSRDFEMSATEGRVVLSHGNLAPDQDLILSANFAADSLTRSTPHWQVRRSELSAAAAQGFPIGLAAGLATLILGGVGLFTYTRAHRRELNIEPIATIPTPPSEAQAAVVGKLTGQSHSFMGAIFDLAQRGLLEVHEEKGLWGMKRHTLVRTAATASLQPFEQGLMDALFKQSETEIPLNKVSARLAARKRLFDEPLEQVLIQRGWRDPERIRTRSVLLTADLTVLILALVILLASLMIGGIGLGGGPAWIGLAATVAGICAGLFLLAIVFLIYAGRYSTLTPRGEEQSARWKGFAEYLKDVSKGREPATRPDFFGLYLAYAAVFGLGGDWAKYFQELGGVPLPVWFHAAAGSDGDFGAMVAVMSASDSAGSSAGGNGGAGASGGGSSGAG